MKKSLGLLLLVLFMFQFVSADDNGISLSKTHVQLDDSFIVDADNLKIDGEKFTGNAMINFYGPEEDYTLLTHIFEGGFSYEASFCKAGCLLPNVPGNYSVSVSLLDSSLNELEELMFSEPLMVDSALNVILELSQVQITPGEEIKVSGSVQRNADSRLLDNGEVTIVFEGVEYKTQINSQKFVYEFTTPFDVSSNYHDIDVRILDEQGNYGEGSIQFFVVGTPEMLTLSTDKESYLPAENVQIFIGLKDQANEEIVEEVELRLYNAGGKRLVKELLISNEEFDFALDEYAVPGEWKIMAKSNGLKIENYFDVQVVENLEVVLVGQDLEITNKGNVHYSKPLVIRFDDNEESLEKRTNLDPGENISLALYKFTNDGPHNVYIENTDQTFSVDIVDNRGIGERMGDFFGSITGQAVRKSGSGTSDTPFMIFIILLIGTLAVSGIFLRKKGKVKISKKFKVRRKPKVTNDVDEIKSRILEDIKNSGVSKRDSTSFAVSPIIKSEESREPSRIAFDEPMRKESNSAPKQDKTTNLFKLFD